MRCGVTRAPLRHLTSAAGRAGKSRAPCVLRWLPRKLQPTFRHLGTELSESTGKPVLPSGRGATGRSSPPVHVQLHRRRPVTADICPHCHCELGPHRSGEGTDLCLDVLQFIHFVIFWETQGFPHSVGGFETAGLIPRPQRPITSQRLLISASLTLRRDRSLGGVVSSTSLQLPCVPHTLSSVHLLGAFPTTLFVAWLDDAKGTVGVTACPPFMVVPPLPSAAGGEVAMPLLIPNLL